MANTGVVYSRAVDGKVYSFEPSGGLINGALIMQDFETDSYWSLMKSEAIAGKLTGKRLRELPVSTKLQWKDWVKRHPQTLVLSVHGRQDARPGYMRYLRSKRGFMGLVAKDKRLETKAPVYSFQHGQRKIAVPFSAFAGGASFKLSQALHLFLYRPQGVEIFHSTLAFTSKTPFVQKGGRWTHRGATFDTRQGKWLGKPRPAPKAGYDTFWYPWSLTNPKTEVLGLKKKPKKTRFY